MLSFGSATGNLFNRLGKCGLVVKQMRSYQNSQLANFTDPNNGLVGQLNSESDIQALVGSTYINALNSAGAAGNTVSQVAQQVISRMIFRDNPQQGQTLTNPQLNSSVAEVVRQMKAANAFIQAMTITATPTTFTGTGNGIVIASTKRPLDGLVLENSFTESLLLTCTADSYSGGAQVGNESFSVTSPGSQTNVFAFNWPLGSGANTSLSAINGDSSTSQGNVLTNSGFDTWSGGNPSSYIIDSGVSGTNYAQEVTLVYSGTGALRIIGDGSNLTQFRQQFGKSTGTNVTLLPLTQYSVNCFMRRDGTAAGQGTLAIELVDGNSNIVVDFAGTQNTFSVNLTTLTVNYASFTAVFRTPEILPSSMYLRIRLTTALTSGRAVYLDKLSMGQMTQAYKSGPFVSVHSGNVPFVSAPIGDYATVAVANSRDTNTLNSFQPLLFRLFYPNSLNNEFLFPSSVNPTISDGLIG